MSEQLSLRTAYGLQANVDFILSDGKLCIDHDDLGAFYLEPKDAIRLRDWLNCFESIVAEPRPTIKGRQFLIDGYLEGGRFYVQVDPIGYGLECLDHWGRWTHEKDKWALFHTQEAAHAFALNHTDGKGLTLQ